jgi:formyltetrahydrofolate deformylase
LPIDIVGVVSNHFEYQKVVVNHDIPFHHIKVTKENKPQAEAQIMDAGRADRHRADRACPLHADPVGRQMCQKMSGRIINIHHSFLPSFKGANPYKQAYERGVKLIGATAHYVTADLDEGPIIEQDTARVTHAQSRRRLRLDRPRRRKPGAGPRHPRPYPPPHLHQRQPHRRLPGKPGLLCLGTDGLT